MILTECFFKEVYSLSHLSEMTEKRFLQDCLSLSDEKGHTLQARGFQIYRNENNKGGDGSGEFLLDEIMPVNEETFIKRVFLVNNQSKKPVELNHLISCITYFLLGRNACEKAINEYNKRKNENRLPKNGETLKKYLDLVNDSEIYTDDSAFKRIDGYISKEEHTKKLSFVSKEINELIKDEYKTVEANNP